MFKAFGPYEAGERSTLVILDNDLARGAQQREQGQLSAQEDRNRPLEKSGRLEGESLLPYHPLDKIAAAVCVLRSKFCAPGLALISAGKKLRLRQIDVSNAFTIV